MAPGMARLNASGHQGADCRKPFEVSPDERDPEGEYNGIS